MIWRDAVMYFTDGCYGKTSNDIQAELRRRYNEAGVKVLVSAFGSTEFPTSAGADPVQCANNLASFVLNNNLDGADLDW